MNKQKPLSILSFNDSIKPLRTKGLIINKIPSSTSSKTNLQVQGRYLDPLTGTTSPSEVFNSFGEIKVSGGKGIQRRETGQAHGTLQLSIPISMHKEGNSSVNGNFLDQNSTGAPPPRRWSRVFINGGEPFTEPKDKYDARYPTKF